MDFQLFQEAVKNMSDVELFENFKLESYFAKKEIKVRSYIGSLLSIFATFVCLIITQSFALGGICFVVFFVIACSESARGKHVIMRNILLQEIDRRRYNTNRPL